MGKAKVNIPICAALVLLFLTMVSIHMTSGLYARYTSTSTASDSARVAKFDVDATVAAVESNPDKAVLTVTNASEVAVQYSIHVTCHSVLSVTVDGKSLPEGKTVFTDDSWTLAPNSTSAPHTLQFSIEWTDGLTDQKNPSPGETENVTFDFDVDVIATQID